MNFGVTLDEAPDYELDGYRCGLCGILLSLARILAIGDRGEDRLALDARVGQRQQRGIAERDRDLLAVDAWQDHVALFTTRLHEQPLTGNDPVRLAVPLLLWLCRFDGALRENLGHCPAFQLPSLGITQGQHDTLSGRVRDCLSQ